MHANSSKALAIPTFTPFSDSKLVVGHLRPMIDNLQLFFSEGCSRTLIHFAERGWSLDANLFAYEVRKEVLERLRALGAPVEDTVEGPETLDFQLGRLALGGLLLSLPGINLRIRKGRETEIPPSGSEQLRGFYNWNLFAFDGANVDEETPLHLLLLWDLDAKQQLDRMALVCPKGESNREVGWYWQEIIPIKLLADAKTNGSDFRTAFEAENSDVPIIPKGTESQIAVKKKKQGA